MDLDATKMLITVVVGWIIILIIKLVMDLVLGIGTFGLRAIMSILGGR